MERILRPFLAACVVSVIATGVASAQTSTIDTPIAVSLVNQCTGESIFIEGTMTTVTGLTADGSGGLHANFDIKSRGTGVAASGTKYVFSETFNSQLNTSATSGTVTLTQSLTHNLITAGKTQNAFIRIRLHLTLNASGEVTATVEQFEAGCRGSTR
jgi:hypothetical protein